MQFLRECIRNVTKRLKALAVLGALCLLLSSLVVDVAAAQQSGAACTIPDGARTTTDPARIDQQEGAEVTYSYVDGEGEPLLDLRATVKETDGLVTFINRNGGPVVRNQSQPMKTIIEWEFLKPDSDDRVTSVIAMRVDDLDSSKLERVSFDKNDLARLYTKFGLDVESSADDLSVQTPVTIDEGWFVAALAPTKSVEIAFSNDGESGVSGFGVQLICDSEGAAAVGTIGFESDGSAGSGTRWRRLAGLLFVAHGLGGLACWAVGRRVDYHRAEVDPLTGAYNSLAVDRRMQPALDSLPGGGVGVLKVHVQNLSNVAESCGKEAADQLIRTIADRLSDAIRPDADSVIRTGGNEFLVLLTQLHRPLSHAQAIGQRLVTDASNPVDIGDQKISPLVNVGVVYCLEPRQASEVISAADRALGESKCLGSGNCVTIETAV